MAKSKTPAHGPDAVLLTSEDLGVTRAFAPDHAKRLLAYQEEKGLADWQPAAEGATVTDEK